MIAGPYTNPFQPSATRPIQTPAATAFAIAIGLLSNTAFAALSKDIGLEDIFFERRSSPPCFTALR